MLSPLRGSAAVTSSITLVAPKGKGNLQIGGPGDGTAMARLACWGYKAAQEDESNEDD